MNGTCHRCGASLADPSTYCNTCGAPQLRLDAEIAVLQAAAPGAGSPDATNGSSGAAPNEWKAILVSILALSIPLGLLCAPVLPFASIGCCLWISAGATAAVWLYRRRSPSALITPRTGARIGLLTGLATAVSSAVITSADLLMERFLLRHDPGIRQMVEQAVDQSLSQMAQTNPQGLASYKNNLQLLYTPEGVAGAFLFTILGISVGILLFGAMGGVIGARIFNRVAPERT